MKGKLMMVCMLTAIMGSSFLSAVTVPTEKELQNVQVVTLLDLNEHLIQGFTQGRMSDYILECPAGTSLPLKLTLKGQFLALEEAMIPGTPLVLKVLKTCYVRCETGDNFQFSTDLQNWKGFAEFFSGEVKVSLDVLTEGLVAGIELELNQR